MRPLRWKGRYASGDVSTDQRNKHFMGCLNRLMEAARQREHCQELERFLADLGAQLEAYLSTQGKGAEPLIAHFYPRLVAALPLGPYGSGACRKCGLCDLAQERIAAHLEGSVDCLRHPPT
jgi:hypothetical protein